MTLWRPAGATGKRGGERPDRRPVARRTLVPVILDFQPFRQLLVQEGFAVLSVDYRGSTGFGRGFRRANAGEWGHADVHDVIDAARWAAAQPWSNGRLAMFGGSYGAISPSGRCWTNRRYGPPAWTCTAILRSPRAIVTAIGPVGSIWTG